MKRRISLVIALVLSFLMMFSPIARAEETKVQITVTTSESADIEVVKVPLAETNQGDSPPPQTKVKVRILEEGEPNPTFPPIQRRTYCSFTCSNGAPGYLLGNTCVPCESGEPNPTRSPIYPMPDCSLMCSNERPGFLSGRNTCTPC